MHALVLVVVVGSSLGAGFLLGLATLRRGTARRGGATTEPIGGTAMIAPQPVDAGSTDEGAFGDEFADLQAALGAESTAPLDPTEARLARKEDEVAELSARLADLVPLGERLGHVEAALLEERAKAESLEARRAEVSRRYRRLQARWREVPDDARAVAERIADLEARLKDVQREKRAWSGERKRTEKALASAESATAKARARAERADGLLARSRARSAKRLERVKALEERCRRLEEARAEPAAALPAVRTARVGPTPGELLRLDPTGPSVPSTCPELPV